VDPNSPANPSNPNALELLTSTYEEDFKAIATYLYRRTGDHDLATELASETYAKALASLGRWTPKGLPLRHWLFRIATRRLAHHRRAQARRARLFSLLRRSHAPNKPTPTPTLTATPEHNPDSLLHALARLPTDRQDVLYLHHIEELTIEEVALTLSIPRGTVKSRLARARAELAAYAQAPHTPFARKPLP
jgi:RNA polymerase sigma-70 factor (ECF subfamily)